LPHANLHSAGASLRPPPYCRTQSPTPPSDSGSLVRPPAKPGPDSVSCRFHALASTNILLSLFYVDLISNGHLKRHQKSVYCCTAQSLRKRRGRRALLAKCRTRPEKTG